MRRFLGFFHKKWNIEYNPAMCPSRGVKRWTIRFLTLITTAIQLIAMDCSRGLPRANGVTSCPLLLAIRLAARSFYFTVVIDLSMLFLSYEHVYYYMLMCMVGSRIRVQSVASASCCTYNVGSWCMAST